MNRQEEHIAFRNLYDDIHRLRKFERYDQLSKLLDNVSKNETNPLLLISCLRLTFLIQNKIHNWKNIRDRIHNKLKDMNMDANQILFGLIERK